MALWVIMMLEVGASWYLRSSSSIPSVVAKAAAGMEMAVKKNNEEEREEDDDIVSEILTASIENTKSKIVMVTIQTFSLQRLFFSPHRRHHPTIRDSGVKVLSRNPR
jgi:hypothetical protein